MEFLKPEMDAFMPDGSPHESTIYRSAALYMSNPVFQAEREDVTRQRLLFTAIVDDHYDVLFNGSSNERGPVWEEIRRFMVERGVITLADKDWKYTASCYWQNIRKESIRRMAKINIGTVKHARPGQHELDRLVGKVLERRGPGSLETVVRNYEISYTERGEGKSENTASGAGRNEEEEDGDVGHDPENVLMSAAEQMLSNSTSPGVVVLEEKDPQQQQQNHFIASSNQSAMEQLIRSASMKISASTHHRLSQQQQQQNTNFSSSASSSRVLSAANHHKNAIPPSSSTGGFIADSSTPTTGNSSSNEHHQQQHQQQQQHSSVVPATSSSSSSSTVSISQQLGRGVTKTHSQLLAGGHEEMAAEFAMQLKQLMNYYKAWMFDQLFQQQGETAHKCGEDGGGGGGTEVKRPKS